VSNRALVLWSLGLTLPVQFLYILANLVANTGEVRNAHGGAFGCTNFHGTIHACTFGEMLENALSAVLLVNFISFGVFFIAAACAIALVLAVLRKVLTRHAPRDWRNPWWKIW
jgi:hypothetical protein